MAERNFEKMHAWVEERLSDYVDGHLAVNERAQIETHLRECAGCRTSLDALRWTLTLLKQAPAPAVPRSFVLPIPQSRAPAWGLVALRFATVAATLLLFALIATDLLTQFGGASVSAPAPAALMRDTVPALAFVPTPPVKPTQAPTALPPSAPKPAAPPLEAKSEPTKAAAPAALATTAPQPTFAPPRAAENLRTTTAVPGLGAAETTTPSADTQKSGQPITAPRMVGTATVAPSPMATLAPTRTLVPTATTVPTRVAIVAPTPAPAPKATPSPIMFPPLRMAQFATLFAVVFFGALTLLLRRRR